MRIEAAKTYSRHFRNNLILPCCLRPVMADSNEKVKFSQTIKKDTEEWLLDSYPDADGIQEAVRMAVSDARLLREGFNVTLTRGRQNHTQDPHSPRR